MTRHLQSASYQGNVLPLDGLDVAECELMRLLRLTLPPVGYEIFFAARDRKRGEHASSHLSKESEQGGVAAVGHHVALLVLHKDGKEPRDVSVILANGIHELVARLVRDKHHAGRLQRCGRSGGLDVAPYLGVREGREGYPLAVGLGCEARVRQILRVLRLKSSPLLYDQHFLDPALGPGRLEHNRLAERAVVLDGHTPVLGVLDAVLHLTVAEGSELHAHLNIHTGVFIDKGSCHYGKVLL